MIAVTLPWPPKELSPNARTHWRVKAPITKAYRKACWALCLEAKLRAEWEGDIHLWINYFPPDRRARDMDNMLFSSKAAFDGMADALGVNDRRFKLHPFVMEQVGGMVMVTITAGPTK